MSDDSQELDEWVVEIEGRLENPDIFPAPSTESNVNTEEPSIFGNWQCWDDFETSFIPETQKWQFVACMTHWFGLNVRSYLEYMQTKVDLAWSYYHGVDEQFRAVNSKRFIEHLLINSCFLIFAMVSLSDKEEYSKVILDKIKEKKSFPKGTTPTDFDNLLAFFTEHPVKNLLYMMNMSCQIPWFVLEAVYTELSDIGNLLGSPIHKLPLLSFQILYPTMHPSKEDDGIVPEGGFKHLLHIFHWSRTHNEKYLVDSETVKTIGNFHIPSATDLLLSKLVFVKDEYGSIDVSYSNNRRLFGVMQLTPWYLSQNNTQLYQNLLRFEQGYGVFCGLSFTAYVACMACLLQTTSDVRILRENGIIPSMYLDDDDVLRCIQELKILIVDDLKIPNELIILEDNVMAHYRKRAYREFGEPLFITFLKRNRQWLTASAIAGIFLFVFTFLQTVISFLSYIKQ